MTIVGEFVLGKGMIVQVLFMAHHEPDPVAVPNIQQRKVIVESVGYNDTIF